MEDAYIHIVYHRRVTILPLSYALCHSDRIKTLTSTVRETLYLYTAANLLVRQGSQVFIKAMLIWLALEGAP